MTLRFLGEPQEDKRLRQMILVSALLHVFVVLWVLTSSSLSRSLQPQAVAYTVELVSPEKLGTNLPGRGKKTSLSEEPFSSPKSSIAPSVEAEKPQKPVAKPEPQKIVKANEPKPNVKTIAPKEEAKKLETKPTEKKEPDVQEAKKEKPEPQKEETKPGKMELPLKKTEIKPEKAEVKPEKPSSKPKATSALTKAETKASEEKPVKDEEVAADDRDQKIAAALARIKAQTQAKGNASLSEEVKGTGPVTKGGEFGEGGGGVVRGLEFLIYTQQLQKRVQENWIVAEKKPGLIASVSFMIEPNGNVQGIELTQSSGDGAFDQSVVRAIRKAAPFPPPPQLYVQEFATQKIYMNFGGEGRVN